jgi:hypothetical protein
VAVVHLYRKNNDSNSNNNNNNNKTTTTRRSRRVTRVYSAAQNAKAKAKSAAKK